MTTSYLKTLIIRQIMCWSFILINLIMWDSAQNLDASRNIFNTLMNIVLVILVELSNYYQVRSKALLYLRIKASMKQEH